MKKIAEINQIPPGRSKLVMVNDKPVALFNINGKIFAWDNRCPHRGASLSDGNISDSVFQCKYHLWQFDVKKACSIVNPSIKINVYEIEIKNGDIFIIL